MTGKYRLLACSALSAFLLFQPAAAKDVSVESRLITDFALSSDVRQFGTLEFVGGLEMTSSDGSLGGWSGVRIRADGKHFVGVLDTGEWITGALRRDSGGHIATLEDVAIVPEMDARGLPGNSKWRVDSESLALRKGEILVGFERDARIDVYKDPGFATSKPIKSLDMVIPKREMRVNGSTETVAVAPADGPLAGSPITIMENSINKEGNLFAAVLEGPRKGIFYVKKDEPYAVTDGAFLPNGDLLILERRFGFVSGIGMQLRRIKTEDIKPGATVDGEVLLEADASFQIDNMEGLDVFQAEDGSTHIILVSDNNFSILQRNLMLEFKLTE